MSRLKHKFQSPIMDSATANLVHPSAWNDEHDLSNFIHVTEQNFGATLTGYAEFTVLDADVLATSRIRAWLAVEAPAATRDGIAADADEASMEPMNVNVESVATGSFVLSAEALDGPIDGPYKFHYVIS